MKKENVTIYNESNKLDLENADINFNIKFVVDIKTVICYNRYRNKERNMEQWKENWENI